MAVISTASEVACLSGLYATFSMTIPRSVQAITARTIDSQEFSPHVVMQVNITYPPTIITSPCAKLSILAIPYTSV